MLFTRGGIGISDFFNILKNYIYIYLENFLIIKFPNVSNSIQSIRFSVLGNSLLVIKNNSSFSLDAGS